MRIRIKKVLYNHQHKKKLINGWFPLLKPVFRLQNNLWEFPHATPNSIGYFEPKNLDLKISDIQIQIRLRFGMNNFLKTSINLIH